MGLLTYIVRDRPLAVRIDMKQDVPSPSPAAGSGLTHGDFHNLISPTCLELLPARAILRADSLSSPKAICRVISTGRLFILSCMLEILPKSM